jgi:uncharacterized protein (TIGR02444 family)
LSLREQATEMYTREGVEAALLTLQDDYGQCVPLLLWAIWLRPERMHDIAQAVAEARRWETEIIAPLRGVRRVLKESPPDPDEQREALRRAVKQIELEAEFQLLDALEVIGHPGGRPLMHALASVAAAWGHPPPAALLSDLSERLG